MADPQTGGSSYSHFVHMGASYQQPMQQRQPTQHHQAPLPAGARSRDRPLRGSGGGGGRDQPGGHQRRPSRDSDVSSSASELTGSGTNNQLQSQQPQANGGVQHTDGMGGDGGGGTPKATQRPPPPPGFGAAAQTVGGPRQAPTGGSGIGASASQLQQTQLGGGAAPGRHTGGSAGALGAPQSGSASGPTALNPSLVNGVGVSQHLGSSSSGVGGNASSGQKQTSASGPTGSSTTSGTGEGSAPGVGSHGAGGGNGSQSTHLNPSAPPFRSLHGGSLEQVEGNLLAQADANGLKDSLSKLRGLMRQRDAIDTCLISEVSGLVAEAERLAETREQQRQQQAALEEARGRVDFLTSQLAERDNQLSTTRRQLEDKETALRARDTQIRKLECDLAEARRRSSNLERDAASAAQRADTTAAKLASVEQELAALREAYKAQTESHAMEQQQQQQAAQQQMNDGWHHNKAPHLGHMGQPLHQMGGGAPADGSGGPSSHFGVMGLGGLGGPPNASAGMKGAPPPPPPGGFQVPPPLPLFNPLPGGPGGMDAAAAAAAAAQMAGYLDAAGAASGGAGGLFGGDRFIHPPPPPGMPLPPGFHMPPHPHGPPHPMGHPFGAPPLPTPEEIQAKILDLLPSDPADAVQWNERMDAALDGALAPLQWIRDLSHVYGSPRGFMMAHPELFAHRQDGAVYRAPRPANSGSGGGTGGAGNVAARLMGMPPPPPPGMAPHGPPHGPGPFGVMPGLASSGLMFGGSHY